MEAFTMCQALLSFIKSQDSLCDTFFLQFRWSNWGRVIEFSQLVKCQRHNSYPGSLSPSTQIKEKS